jgi:hypothetical protein
MVDLGPVACLDLLCETCIECHRGWLDQRREVRLKWPAACERTDERKWKSLHSSAASCEFPDHRSTKGLADDERNRGV